MKPFNLKEALEGKPVVTRDGRKVLKIVHFESIENEEEECIYAHIEGEEHVDSYFKNGFNLYNEEMNTDDDLFMYEEKKKLWIGIAKTPIMLLQTLGSNVYQVTSACESKEKLLQAMECKLDMYDIRMVEI